MLLKILPLCFGGVEKRQFLKIDQTPTRSTSAGKVLKLHVLLGTTDRTMLHNP
jgi:hypothetical protein